MMILFKPIFIATITFWLFFHNVFAKEVLNDSLFHNEDEIEKMHNMLDALSRGDKLENLFAGEQKVKQDNDEKIENNISFFLNSILYRGENNWSIWLNGKKISSSKKSNDIEILFVTNKLVKLRWKTGYSIFVEKLSDVIKQNNIPKGVKLEILDSIAIVTFILRVNQELLLENELYLNEGKKREEAQDTIQEQQ